MEMLITINVNIISYFVVSKLSLTLIITIYHLIKVETIPFKEFPFQFPLKLFVRKEIAWIIQN